MNPTAIEWVLNQDGSPGFTSNPFTGCLGPKGDGIRCPYCYAWRESLGRCKQADLSGISLEPGHDDDPFYPRFHPERLVQIRSRQKPAGIFLCDRSDFAASYWPLPWQMELRDMIKSCPQHRFYLLTHQPQELQKWSPFPPNCFVGVSATAPEGYKRALAGLAVIQARVKYLSIEPFLERIPMSPPYELSRDDVQWLIIGAMTGKRKELMQLSRQYSHLTLTHSLGKWTLQPKLEWILELAEAADKAHISLFLKNNLLPMIIDSPAPQKTTLYGGAGLRQEMPE